MTIFLTIIVFLFVIGVLAVVGYALYEMTPLPRRSNPYRDVAGHRRWESPHLEKTGHDAE